MYCEGCGRPGEICAGCSRPLDPPRFCRECGRKLRVQVTPVGYVARCYEHGEVHDDGRQAGSTYDEGAPSPEAAGPDGYS